jgi:hypothetical protein
MIKIIDHVVETVWLVVDSGFKAFCYAETFQLVCLDQRSSDLSVWAAGAMVLVVIGASYHYWPTPTAQE